jgi:DNA mismatch repair protein MutS2
MGAARLATLRPETDALYVQKAQHATSEGVAFLNDHLDFPLRAPEGLQQGLDALGLADAILEPLQLMGLASFLESVVATQIAVIERGKDFPSLRALVATVASFTGEIKAVRRAIDPTGDVTDTASPELTEIRNRLRRQRTKLRGVLEGFLQGKNAKYLQEHIVTDRNGRYVLLVRTEYHDAIPGIVHGSSTSGASLFLEPMDTVAINNDIVTLKEREADEIRRILLTLTDAFRNRPEDLRCTVRAATDLDVLQARARFSKLVEGVEPAMSLDGGLILNAARHPLLMSSVIGRLEGQHDKDAAPVPIDIRIELPARMLVIAGPNTGGKTVALKTVGLLSMMAQSGLHVPAGKGSRLPVFKSVFADIGDEQSITASLSTFSAHITNMVLMDRELSLPALILLDEVGAGTDPIEGSALGVAILDYFRQRGAYLIATTHYASLKSYASTTPNVVGAAFGFDPETFTPTYTLAYGSSGRSLALEIAASLGMPPSVIKAARDNLTEPEKQLAEHLTRLEQELSKLAEKRMILTKVERALRQREDDVQEREQLARKRLHRGVDEQVRNARRRIEAVIAKLKAQAAEMSSRSELAPRLNTGATGEMRATARTAVDQIAQQEDTKPWHSSTASERGMGTPPSLAPGVQVHIVALDLVGRVVDLHDNYVEVDVNGKRMRTKVTELRAVSPKQSNAVKVNVDLVPREKPLTELNVIGCTVDEALARTEKFLDQSMMGDVHSLRLIHGHGTGQLRRALTEFLNDHPMVAHIASAPDNQGAGGVTVVELKD